MAFVVAGLVCALIGALGALAVLVAKYVRQRRRFAPVIDAHADAARIRTLAVHEVAHLQVATANEIAQLNRDAQRYQREAHELVARGQQDVDDQMARARAEAKQVITSAIKEAGLLRKSMQQERDHQAKLADDTARMQSTLERLRDELGKVEGNRARGEAQARGATRGPSPSRGICASAGLRPRCHR